MSNRTEEKVRPENKEDRAENRPKRVPLHEARNILTVDLPDDLVGRFVLDKPNRIETFLRAGYFFVNKKGLQVGDPRVDGSKIPGDTVAVPNKDGRMLYLMAIEKELYDADQAAKQKPLDEMEDAIRAELNQPGKYGHFETKTKS